MGSSGVELDFSIHVGGEDDAPPLTVCVAPSDDAAVGVLTIGPLRLEPNPDDSHPKGDAKRAEHGYEDSKVPPVKHAPRVRDASSQASDVPRSLQSAPQMDQERERLCTSGRASQEQAAPRRMTASDGGIFQLATASPQIQCRSGVALVSWALSSDTPVADRAMTVDEARAKVAAARRSAEVVLLPRLLQERQVFLNAGIDLVLVYDLDAGLAMWVQLGDRKQPRRVLLGPDTLGRLQINILDRTQESKPRDGRTIIAPGQRYKTGLRNDQAIFPRGYFASEPEQNRQAIFPRGHFASEPEQNRQAIFPRGHFASEPEQNRQAIFPRGHFASEPQQRDRLGTPGGVN